jgi:hypothetical protein
MTCSRLDLGPAGMSMAQPRCRSLLRRPAAVRDSAASAQVPRLARARLVAACKDDEARRIVENVIDGTAISEEAPWAYDGVYCAFTALRALLAPHAPLKSGRCAACRRRWPCWPWREAYAWIALYDPVHGGRVYDWCHHTAGDPISIR